LQSKDFKHGVMHLPTAEEIARHAFGGAYHASKFALEGMMQVLRIELTPFGIEVITIEPSLIATPMWRSAPALAEGILNRVSPKAREYSGSGMEAARASAANVTRHGAPPEKVGRRYPCR
jgi:NAD(P)-dependent dehydrogenase (short-subunit alcohol dehydrogenase family)